MKFLCRIAVAMGIGWFSAGCSTPDRNLDAARSYLQKLEADKAAPAAATEQGPDAPESPVSRLPPAAARAGNGATVEDAAAQPAEGERTIQPDSVVQVTVAEDPSLNGSYTVNDIGAIQFGYVGPVILYNRTEQGAARKIEDILKTGDFKKATVKVRLLRASYDKVSVNGAVGSSGILKIGANDATSLNDLLLRANGLRCPAGHAVVRVVRGGLLTPLAPFLPGEEYRLVDDEGRPAIPDVRLRNNDVAYVEERPDTTGAAAGGADSDMGGKTILVLGEVSRKGFYYFAAPERCSMMHLLFKMGGMPPYAKTTGVRVVRRDKDGVEEEFIVNAKKIMDEGNPEDDFQLLDGDRVIVPARRIALF